MIMIGQLHFYQIVNGYLNLSISYIACQSLIKTKAFTVSLSRYVAQQCSQPVSLLGDQKGLRMIKVTNHHGSLHIEYHLELDGKQSKVSLVNCTYYQHGLDFNLGSYLAAQSGIE